MVPIQVQAVNTNSKNAISGSYEISNTNLPKSARASAQNSLSQASTSVNLNNLSDLEDVIRNNMDNRVTKFSVTYTGDTSNLKSNISSAIDDIFSQDDYLNYSYTAYGFNYSGYENDVTINFSFSYLTTKSQEDFVNEKVTSILGQIIDSSMNVDKKEKAIHDYIVENVQYDTSLTRYSAYNALSEGKTVCQGYALLTYKMLNQAGVECKIISGYATSGGETESHAWNLVRLNGKWYHLDCTWDDPVPDVKGRVTYDYYNITDSQISKDHIWDTSAYPAATTVYDDSSDGISIDFSAYKKWSSESSVSKDKIWSIKFTKPFDASTVNSSNILVYEENNNLLYAVDNIKVSYNANEDTIYVEPGEEYTTGKTYCLIITKNVLSKDDEVIPRPIVFTFTVD